MNIPSQLMIEICNDPEFGYSQGSNRWGNEKVKTFYIDGNTYNINAGDRDCSSAIISVYNSVYPNEYPFGSAYYTGNMIDCALETGKWQFLGKISNTTGLKPASLSFPTYISVCPSRTKTSPGFNPVVSSYTCIVVNS